MSAAPAVAAPVRMAEPPIAGRSIVERLAQVVGVAALYFVAARLGLTFAYVNESATAVWPPTGIALAAAVFYGWRVWPGIVIGAFLANVFTSGSIPASAMIASGNTLEALAGAALVNRYAGGVNVLSRTADVFRFAALAGLAAPVIGATIGVSSLLWHDLAAPAAAPSIWITWWLGDGAGAVAFAPFLLAWARPHVPLRPRVPSVELLLLGATACAMAFVGVTGQRGYPIEFVFTPVVLWAAFRVGLRAALTCVVGFSAVAVWSTLSGDGPLGRMPPNDALLYVQGFVAVMAVLGAAVGALAGEYAALQRDLAQRVDERTASLNEAQALAHLGSWEWDVDRNVVRWSDELCRLFGVPPGTALTYEQFVALLHPDDRSRVQRIVARGVDTAEPFVFEHRIVRADGSVRVLAARGRVDRDASGRVIRLLGTGQDITDRRQAEEERAELAREQAARRELEDANRLKDEFLAMISHELRTPLNAVLGWAHILTESAIDREQLSHGLRVIERNALAQKRLIENLLDVSAVSQGRLRLVFEPVDLAAVTRAALDSVALAAQAKHIGITTALPPGAIVEGDAQRLQQVAWNLFANAVKFTPPEGRIDISVQPEADGAILVVADTGSGIAADVLPHIFGTFWRGPGDAGQPGLGLGLAIVRAFVEAHGGVVEASSGGAGCGATFRVRLPRERAGTAAPSVG
jgi:PAS domain S-box-containing protein